MNILQSVLNFGTRIFYVLAGFVMFIPVIATMGNGDAVETEIYVDESITNQYSDGNGNSYGKQRGFRRRYC